MTHPRNIVGPQIRAQRIARGWKQSTLVARLGLLGWGISRETLAKIEAQIRWVADVELVCLAAALETEVELLLPSKKARRQIIRDLLAPKWKPS